MPFYQNRRKIPPSMTSCSICSIRTECIRCSALSQVDPKRPDKLRDLVAREIYRDKEPTQAMLQGTADHKELEGRRKADTDPESVIERIKRKETFYFSLSFCSVRYGLRGTVDAVLVDWQRNNLRFLIIDDKTHVSGHYFRQIWAYGMILSDPNCLYTKSIDGEGEEVERKPFYPAIGDIFDTLEIWTTLNPYKQQGRVVDRPLPAKPFPRARIFVDKGLVFAVLRLKRKIIEAFSEPALLAATQQMKFKRSGNQLELYLPKARK
ncbi:MAG TPA: hypothetical protein VFE91_06435 [Nitrososphaerales archaeon]|nr:hypothetical protein [Nitrososphaerales archaeon]